MMTNLEKLADDLGQITFRLETNMQTLQRRTSQSMGAVQDVAIDIMRDVEKLKDIKTRILGEVSVVEQYRIGMEVVQNTLNAQNNSQERPISRDEQ